MVLTRLVQLLAGMRVAQQVIVRPPEEHCERVRVLVQIGAHIQVACEVAGGGREGLQLPAVNVHGIENNSK